MSLPVESAIPHGLLARHRSESVATTDDDDSADTESRQSLRSVRFDHECVLIPDPPRSKGSSRPRVVMKKYSLPLWNRKPSGSQSQAVSDSEVDANEDGHIRLKVKVTVPRLITKSPSWTMATAEPGSLRAPLTPCLVRNVPGSSRRQRPPAPPSLLSSSPRTADLVTVPLRACCSNCVNVTEESMKEGQDWKERFTRGARRRRRLSSTSSCSDGIEGAPACPSFAGAKVISVDEVDKRRKSRESGSSELDRDREQEVVVSLNDEGVPLASPCSPRPMMPSADSPCMSSIAMPMRGSPIQEEDEDQLFPLPSPRRSPTPSPSGSPSTSTSALTLTTEPSSQESIPTPTPPTPPADDFPFPAAKPKRTHGQCEKGFLTPEPSPPPPFSPPAADELLPPSTPVSAPAVLCPSLSRRERERSTSSIASCPDRPPSPPLSPIPAPASLSSHPLSPKAKRRSSLSQHAASFLRVGVDVLRGVNAVGGPPGAPLST